MIVYVIESGDYEQRGVDGIASSLEAAVEWLKRMYPPPYIVQWNNPRRDIYTLRNGETRDPGYWEIVGHFEAVDGYSCRYDCTYRITPYELDGARGGVATEPEKVTA